MPASGAPPSIGSRTRPARIVVVATEGAEPRPDRRLARVLVSPISGVPTWNRRTMLPKEGDRPCGRVHPRSVCVLVQIYGAVDRGTARWKGKGQTREPPKRKCRHRG